MSKFSLLASKYIGTLVKAPTWSNDSGKIGAVVEWWIGAKQNGIWLLCQHETGTFKAYRSVK